VRDLLRHTAGIPYRGGANAVEKMYVKRGIDNGGGPVVLPEDGSEPVTTLSELARRIAGTPLLDQPGQRFRYGNATDVLGRVVEVASGQSLGGFLSERIFQPLGMRDTAFQVPAQAVDRLSAAYYAKSSTPGGDRVLRQADTASLKSTGASLAEDPSKSVFAKPRAIAFGGAGLVSTAADYQRFLQLLRDGGSVDGKRLVSAASIAEMVRNQLPPAALEGSALAAQGLGFGLGVAVVTNPSLAPAPLPAGSYFWGGAASTYFWVDPSRRLTGVVMTQVFGGDVGPFYLDILRALYGPQQPAAHVQPRHTAARY
jgi:CubicO group peptidase (beta-lactamase class C family)